MSELWNCRHCGGQPTVEDQGYGFVVACDNCYDGAPDAGPQDIASGRTEDGAIRDWNGQMTDHAREEEARLRTDAEKVYVEAITKDGGALTPSTCSALLRVIKNEATLHPQGITKAELGRVARRLSVELHSGTRLVWVGSIGPRGGVKGRQL